MYFWSRKITNNFLRNNFKLEWDENYHMAFEKLKLNLVAPDLLIYLDFEKPFYITLDASMEALEHVFILDTRRLKQTRSIC